MSTTTTKKPIRNVYYVKDDLNGGEARWIKIGSAFPHEDGKGETLLLDALPLNFDGRITIRERKLQE